MFPRFTLREMFLATALIAVGLAGVLGIVKTFGQVNHTPAAIIASIAALLVGAAAGAPIQRKLVGAIVGVIFYVILVAYSPPLK